MPDSLSRRLAELEGAESALVLASGVAATACTMQALLRSGDHLLASAWLRAETRRFCEEVLPTFGVAVSFVNPRETRGWRRALTRTSRAVLVESPVLASTRVVDLNPVRMLASELGLALVVDSTAASPVNFRPLAHGADIVVHDGRPLLAAGAAGEVGVVCGTESLIDEVRVHRARWGAVAHPAAAEALARGLDTLDVRVQRQNTTARLVADWALQAAAVASVQYPGLASHPDHEIARDTLAGFGNLVLLDLHDADTARGLCEASDARERQLTAGMLTTRVVAGDSPTTVCVAVAVEPSGAVIDWLASHLA